MIMIKMFREYPKKMREKNPQIKKWKLRIIKTNKAIKERKKWM